MTVERARLAATAWLAGRRKPQRRATAGNDFDQTMPIPHLPLHPGLHGAGEHYGLFIIAGVKEVDLGDKPLPVKEANGVNPIGRRGVLVWIR